MIVTPFTYECGYTYEDVYGIAYVTNVTVSKNASIAAAHPELVTNARNFNNKVFAFSPIAAYLYAPAGSPSANLASALSANASTSGGNETGAVPENLFSFLFLIVSLGLLVNLIALLLIIYFACVRPAMVKRERAYERLAAAAALAEDRQDDEGVVSDKTSGEQRRGGRRGVPAPGRHGSLHRGAGAWRGRDRGSAGGGHTGPAHGSAALPGGQPAGGGHVGSQRSLHRVSSTGVGPGAGALPYPASLPLGPQQLPSVPSMHGQGVMDAFMQQHPSSYAPQGAPAYPAVQRQLSHSQLQPQRPAANPLVFGAAGAGGAYPLSHSGGGSHSYPGSFSHAPSPGMMRGADVFPSSAGLAPPPPMPVQPGLGGGSYHGTPPMAPQAYPQQQQQPPTPSPSSATQQLRRRNSKVSFSESVIRL